MNETLILLIGSFIVSIIYFAAYLKTRIQVFLNILVFIIVLFTYLFVSHFFAGNNPFLDEAIIGTIILISWALFSFAPLEVYFSKKTFYAVYISTSVIILGFFLFFSLTSVDFIAAVRGLISIPLIFSAIYLPFYFFFKTGKNGYLAYSFFVIVAAIASVVAITDTPYRYMFLLVAILLITLGLFGLNSFYVRPIGIAEFFGKKIGGIVPFRKRVFALISLVAILSGAMISAAFFVVTRDLARDNASLSLRSRAESATFIFQSEVNDGYLHLSSFAEKKIILDAFKDNSFDSLSATSFESLELAGIIDRVYYLNAQKNIIGTRHISGDLNSEIIDNDRFFSQEDKRIGAFDIQNELLVLRLPVNNGDGVIGYIDGYLNFNAIVSDVIESLGFSDAEKVYLADSHLPYYRTSDGVVLATPQSAGVPVKTCADLNRVCTGVDCTKSQKEISGYFGASQVSSIGFVMKIPDQDACVVTEISEDQIVVSPSRASLFASVMIFSLLAIIFSIISYYLTRSITKPLKNLKEGVRDIRKGDYETRLEIESNDEFSELAGAFNELVEDLKNSQSDIGLKIESKTHELEEEKEKLERTQRAMLNVLQDVSLDKDRLSHEKEKIEVIVQSLKEGFIFVGLNQDIVLFNKAAELITGHSGEAVLGKSFLEYFSILDDLSKEKIKLNLDDIKNSAEGLAPKNVLLENSSSLLIPIRLTASVVRHENDILGFVVVFQDTSHEREIEKMKSNFVSIVSHQLRTPLSAVKWLLEMILGEDVGKISEEQRDFLTRAFDSNERMIVLVSELLKVSRLESGKIQPKPEKINVEAIVRGVVGDHSVNAKAHNCELVINEPQKKIPEIEADPVLIENVLDNFVSNAIDYARHQNQNSIQITTSTSKGQVLVSVKDEGIGIEKKDFDKVFGMFYRGDNATKARTDGSGLGLYIAKLMIELSGGKVWFESEYEKGSTFYFSLPIKK